MRISRPTVVMTMLLVALTWTQAVAAQADSQAAEVLQLSGVQGGLCVHLDGRDVQLVADIARGGKFIVHGLCPDAKAAADARQRLSADGLAGMAGVDCLPVNRLPYADSLVNLLVVEDLPAVLKQGLTPAEVLRVLAPRGVACLGVPAQQQKQVAAQFATAGVKDIRFEQKSRGWLLLVKPRPAGMDDWGQYRHASDGNLVSADLLFEMPNQLRWIAGPSWPLPRGAAGPADGGCHGMISANGRNYYIIGSRLAARDAFNGLLLWIQPCPKIDKTRLAASGDEVYLCRDGELVALAGATGQVVRTYGKSATCQRLMLEGGLLLCLEGDAIRAFDLAGGQEKWSSPQAGLNAASAVCDQGRLSFAAKGGALVSIELADGKPAWKKDMAADVAPKVGLLFAYKGKLVFGGDTGPAETTFHAISGQDGAKAWSFVSNKKGAAAYGAGGLVWIETENADFATPINAFVAPQMKQWKPAKWQGLEPETGNVRQSIISPVGQPWKCYPMLATERFMITNRPHYLVDWKDGKVFRFEATRPGCYSSAFCVAQGMYYGLYTNSNLCMCMYSLISGVTAFGTDGKTPNGEVALEEQDRLQAGQAKPPEPAAPAEGSWPTYRGDMKRTAAVAGKVPAQLAPAWASNVLPDHKPASQPASAAAAARTIPADWLLNKPVGDAITQPTVAQGKVFVSLTHAQQVVALDESTGKTAWTFSTPARLDAPPTVAGGLCLVGCHDGWVYCLRADDGQLVWRFRAAPAERRMIAYGQLESAWPVVGPVVVADDVAYAIAGRTTESDGGLYVSAVELRTGTCLWSTRNVKPEAGDMGPYNARPQTTYVGPADILCCDGKSIAIAGCPRGRFKCKSGELFSDTSWGGRKVGWMQSRYSRDRFGTEWAPVALTPGKIFQPWADKKGRYVGVMSKDGWKCVVPAGATVEAVVAVGESVLAAVNYNQADSPGGELWVLSAADGQKVATAKLSGAPAFDGLAFANGRIYVSCQDGSVECLKGQ